MANKGVRDSDVLSVSSHTASSLPNDWENEKICIVCNSKVSKTAIAGNKRFGCKFCGHAVCAKCSPNRELHPDTNKPERICNDCYRRKGGQDVKSQMEETLAHACSEIERLDGELQAEIRAKQEEQVARHRKEKECEQLQAKIFGLTAQLASVSLPDPSLQARLSNAQTELADHRVVSDRLIIKVATLEKTNEELKAELDRKKTDMIATLTELTETKGKLMTTKETEMQLKSALDDQSRANELISDLRKAKTGLESSLESLQKQLSESHSELTRKSTELIDIKQANTTTVHDLERKLTELQTENKSFALQIQAFKQDHDLAVSSAASQLAELPQLKSKLSESEQKVSELTTALAEAESLRSKLEKDTTAKERILATKMETLQKMIQDFTAAADEQRITCEEKEEEIEKLTAKLKETELKWKEAETNRETAARTAAESEAAQVGKLSLELSSLRDKLKSVEITATNRESQCSGLISDLKTANEQSTALKYERDSLHESVKSLQGDLQEANSTIEEWRLRCSKAQQDVAVLSDKLAAANTAFETAQKQASLERERLVADVKALQGEMRTYVEEANRVKREAGLEVHSLTSENRNLKEKVGELAECVEQLASLKAEKSQKDLELTAATERLRSLEEMHSILDRRHTDTLDRLKLETDTNLAHLESLRADKIRLTSELAQSNMTIVRWEERVREAESERDKARLEMEDLHQAMSRGENEQIKTLSAENKDLQKIVNEQTELRHALEGQVQTYVLQAKTAAATIENDKESLARLQAETDRLNSKCKERQAEVTRLSQELSASKEHAARLSTHNSELKNAVDIKEIECAAKLKKVNEGGSVEIQRLEEQLQAYRQETARVEEDSHRTKLEHTRKLREVESQVGDLSSQLSSSKSTIVSLQKEVSREKETYERDKSTALEMIDSLNARLRESNALAKELEGEKGRLLAQLEHYVKTSEELSDNLAQERVLTLQRKKDAGERVRLVEKRDPEPAVVEDVEEMRLPTPPEASAVERKTTEQNAAVRRITAVRGVTKTMTERELDTVNEDGFRLKRKGSDPSARDACRCTLF